MAATRRTLRLALLASTAAAAALALTAPGAGASGPKFGAPVLLTTDANAGGYEPGIVVDRYGNIVVTAHKQNHTLVVSPDSNSPTKTRSMSWVWWSKDSGKTFRDMPGATGLDEQNAEFGDEGDLATDATGHIYFVDTNVTDVSFSRWHADGRGKITLETTRPLNPMGEPVDDRPWIAAHGDGVVMYLGNEGDTQTYQGGQRPMGGNGDSANGPGRYTVYMSYDHGDTFNTLGYTLGNSGWCRPIADKHPGSRRFYIVCSDDTGTHYAFETHDDGHHFQRYEMGQYTGSSWINGTVASDGTVYAEYHDRDSEKNNHIKLYSSKDHGHTWAKRDITPPGDWKMDYSWMDVAPNGTLGVAFYGSHDGKHNRYLYVGAGKPTGTISYSRVSPMKLAEDVDGYVWGDFFQIAFGPDSKLNVVWTVDKDIAGQRSLNSDIYYARQR
jgi:hypothetical protein